MSDTAFHLFLALAVVLLWAATTWFMDLAEDHYYITFLKDQARDPAKAEYLRHRFQHLNAARTAGEVQGSIWSGLAEGGLFLLLNRLRLIIGFYWSLISGRMRRQARALQRLADELEKNR